MRKVLPIAIGALLAGTAMASAADLAVKARPVVPPVPVFSWTGFYAGINGGIGGDKVDYPFSALNNTYGGNVGMNSFGGFGGGQIGYNWQFAPNWVFGIEADIQGSGIKSDLNGTINNLGSISAGTELTYFGTVRGRLGYSLGSTLFYATGGLVYGNVKTRVQEAFLGGAIDATFSHTKAGYAVGGGIESPFEFLGLFGPNWTSKTEYLYVDLGRTTDTYTVSGTTHVFSTRVEEHVFRTGLNYHFNTPVVAKY